jgi:hypothetical protein
MRTWAERALESAAKLLRGEPWPRQWQDADELQALAAKAGLRGGRFTERFDCFAGTSAGNKVSLDLHVHAANFFSQKEPP